MTRCAWLTALFVTGFVAQLCGQTQPVISGGGPAGGPVSALVVDPLNSGTVYAGTNYGVFKSTNGGQSWTSSGLRTFIGFGAEIDVLAIDPHTSTLYAQLCVEICFLYKTTDGGENWAPAGIPAGSDTVAFDPSDSAILYAGACDWPYTTGVWKSTDGGVTWTAVQKGCIGTITIDPRNPAIIYAVTLDGIIKSTDGGASWTTLPVSNLKKFSAVVLIDRADANVIYVVGEGRLLKSTDGGVSWTAASSGIIGPVYNVVVDPSKSTILYAVSSTGVFKSVDGGVTWAPSNSGNGFVLAIDPNNPAVLYLGGVSGVFKTVDAATSWTAVNGGLDTQSLYALAVRAGTLYAGTAVNGVFQSGDGGASWARAGNGLGFARALVIDPTNSSTVYAGAGRVYKSVDGGANWTPTPGYSDANSRRMRSGAISKPRRTATIPRRRAERCSCGK